MTPEPQPLAVWDAASPNWTADFPRFLRRIDWAEQHIPRCADTYLVEFFLVDAPFAVLYRHARNDDGRLYVDRETRSIAVEGPFTVLLAALPPEDLLQVTPPVAGHGA